MWNFLANAAATWATNELFNKEPDKPSSQDFINANKQGVEAVNLPPVTWQMPDLNKVQQPDLSSMLQQFSFLQTPKAPTSESFQTPGISSQALQQGFDMFSRMAKTGFGTPETEEYSQTQYDLAAKRSRKAVQEAGANLTERMAGRGIGQSGIAAGQMQELQGEAALGLSELANQIARYNAEKKFQAQKEGAAGMLGVGGQAFSQATTQQQFDRTGTQQDFQNMMNRMRFGLDVTGAATQFGNQRYQQDLDKMLTQTNLDRQLNMDIIGRESSRYNIGQGMASGAGGALNTGYQNDWSRYLQGEQDISSFFGRDPAQNATERMQRQLLQLQIDRLQPGNTSNMDPEVDYNTPAWDIF